MSEEKTEALSHEAAHTAEIKTKRGFSAIWLIPLIALIIGGWLAFKAISEKGPLITIHFKTAEGLVAGKTKLKYLDVDIGEVEDITLHENTAGVIVKARMEPETKPYLTDQTRFWVVRAEISAGRIAALGTLLSGAYIGVDPIGKGKKTREFKGLEKPPLVTTDDPGRRFKLTSPVLGSLTVGSPIFYRQINVGQVIDYKFNAAGDAVELDIFVNEPHHQMVNSATKFWNASGIDFKMSATGIEVDTQSLISILQGGVAFETPANLADKKPVAEHHQFQLFATKAAAQEKTYTIKNHYLMFFDQSVRGLVPGAPVEFRGIRIGKVLDVKLILDADTLEAKIPVLIEMEPERMEIWYKGKRRTYEDAIEKGAGKREGALDESLHQQGLRAQLKTGSLLTGQLYIDLDFFPALGPSKVTQGPDYLIFPTAPSALGQLTESIAHVMKKIDKIPFDELGQNLNSTIVTLKSTLEQFKATAATVNEDVLPDLGKTVANINEQVIPNIDKTLIELQKTVKGVDKSLGPDSAINYKTQQALDELTGAIRSVKSVTDELDRNPRALIFGRGGEKQ